MGQRKREEKAAEAEGDYQFPTPTFDEKAFIRREVDSAKITLWTAGIAIGIGLLSWLMGTNLPSPSNPEWKYGLLPIAAGMAGLTPLLKRLGFSDEMTKPKAMIGNWFLMFFTALSVWAIALNV